MKTITNKHKHLKTNIAKLQQLYDMRSHEAEKVDQLISEYLPFGYARKAQENLKKVDRDVSCTYIRQVKRLFECDLQILNSLIELATEKKAVAEAEKARFQKLLTDN